MTCEIDDRLVIAISSRALFALDDAAAVFQSEGIAAHRAHQRSHESEVLGAGPAMPLARALLRINEVVGRPLVEVIVVSQDDADTGQRVIQSADALGLPITRAAFTAGDPAAPYLGALAADLFLSADPVAVSEAISSGIAAAQVLPPPDGVTAAEDDPVVTPPPRIMPRRPVPTVDIETRRRIVSHNYDDCLTTRRLRPW